VGGWDYISAAPNRSVDVEVGLAWNDNSSAPHPGRLYMVYTDAVEVSSDDTNIEVCYSDNDDSSWSDPVQVNDDDTTNSQFLPRIAIDYDTGNIAVSWYDCRNDPSDIDTQYFASVSTDGGASFLPNVQVSAGTSDYDGSNYFGYGDFSGLAFDGGSLYPSWADDSNSTGDNPDGTSGYDVYTARVILVSTGGQSLSVTGTTANDQIDVTLDPSGTYLEVWENNSDHTGRPSFTATITALTSIEINGSGGTDTLNLESGIFATSSVGIDVEVDTGTLTISSTTTGSLEAPAELKLSSLTVGFGAKVTLNSGQDSLLYLHSLNLGSTGSYGTLDLTNETMVLDPSSNLDSATLAEIENAYDSGTWAGTGITSSLAPNYPQGGTTLGYLFNNVTGETWPLASTYSITLGSNAIIVAYTFKGDTNLDGVVDSTDAFTNFGSSGAADWFHGNFNYDGYINSDDFALLSLGDAVQNEGNVDGNSSFDAGDVPAFAAAIAAGSESAFLAEYPDGDYSAADINGDGYVNSEDIAGFDQIAADAGFAGFLNPLFGNNGITVTSGSAAVFFAETTDSNGNILATGQDGYNMVLARYHPDGTLDTSFGTDGMTIVDLGEWEAGYAILAMSNGEILVAGNSQSYPESSSVLAMFHSDGTLDTSFGDDGTTVVNVSSGYNVILGLTLQSNGQILACSCAYQDGYSNVGLTRFNADGTVDTSFGTDGTTLTTFDSWDVGSDVAVLADGSILVSGADCGVMAVIKYNSDGTFDSSFGSDGVASVGIDGSAVDMVVLSSGKIVVAGYTSDGAALAQLNSDGSIDTSFGTDGIVDAGLGSGSTFNGLIVQSNGQIVASGYIGDDIVIARYNSDGSADTSFGMDGMTLTDLGYSVSTGMQQMLVQQANGNYVVATGANGNFILAGYQG
jgi:uncharacterized delta-60 repeat protein